MGLLDYFKFSDKKDVFKTWYDGYHIGNKEIYCPWDVVSYLSDLREDPTNTPLTYWKKFWKFRLTKINLRKVPRAIF